MEPTVGSGSLPEDDPDVKLMLRVRDDDAEAFAELVMNYQPKVLLLKIQDTKLRQLMEAKFRY